MICNTIQICTLLCTCLSGKRAHKTELQRRVAKTENKGSGKKIGGQTDGKSEPAFEVRPSVTRQQVAECFFLFTTCTGLTSTVRSSVIDLENVCPTTKLLGHVFLSKEIFKLINWDLSKINRYV